MQPANANANANATSDGQTALAGMECLLVNNTRPPCRIVASSHLFPRCNNDAPWLGSCFLGPLVRITGPIAVRRAPCAVPPRPDRSCLAVLFRARPTDRAHTDHDGLRWHSLLGTLYFRYYVPDGILAFSTSSLRN
jgi:hypothetical protein